MVTYTYTSRCIVILTPIATQWGILSWRLLFRGRWQPLSMSWLIHVSSGPQKWTPSYWWPEGNAAKLLFFFSVSFLFFFGHFYVNIFFSILFFNKHFKTANLEVVWVLQVTSVTRQTKHNSDKVTFRCFQETACVLLDQARHHSSGVSSSWVLVTLEIDVWLCDCHMLSFVHLQIVVPAELQTLTTAFTSFWRNMRIVSVLNQPKIPISMSKFPVQHVLPLINTGWHTCTAAGARWGQSHKQGCSTCAEHSGVFSTLKPSHQI